ncbi:MAG: Lrp/AsnC family transcriptional regulator [Acidobacteria bacterium]|nr:Lrp/AsnC family transcriptional regulator [Acidobacteriota bacterium]
MALENEKLLDEIGWRILAELQENARLTFAELGRRVGLSIPAVTERVHRLQEAGIITGYRAEIDPEKVGYPITAFIRMSINGGTTAKIEALVKDMPEVSECHRGTGVDSFVMKVNVLSVAHLESLIDRLLPYGTTTTSIILPPPVKRPFIERPPDGKTARNARKTKASR